MQHYLRLLLIGLFIVVTSNLPAQNVGINTTTPHLTAALDIQSTTRGLLIPRMTTAERNGIAGAATGLMVFDNTTNSFWYKRPSNWEQVMDFSNASWTDNGTTITQADGMRVTIAAGSPQGQGRLNVMAETSTPNSRTPFIQLLRTTTGTAAPGLAGAIDFILEANTGSLPTSASIVCEAINTTPGSQTASLEFFTTAGGVTNSSLYLGPANVGIGTSTPSIFSKFDVNGNINTSGKVMRNSVTGASNLVPLCYGAVDAAGTVTSGTGNFSVLKTATGIYLISGPDIDANCIFIVTSRSSGTFNARMFTTTFLAGDVYIAAFNSSGVQTDSGFHFTVYKQ